MKRYRLKWAERKGTWGEIQKKPGWMLLSVASQASSPERWGPGFLLVVSRVSLWPLHDWPLLHRFQPLRAKAGFIRSHIARINYMITLVLHGPSTQAYKNPLIRQSIPRLRAHPPGAGQGSVLKTDLSGMVQSFETTLTCWVNPFPQSGPSPNLALSTCANLVSIKWYLIVIFSGTSLTLLSLVFFFCL